MVQHAFIWTKRVRPSRTTIGATSFDVEPSSFRVHMSLALSSERHESLVVVYNAPKVQPTTVVLGVYSVGPSNTSLFYLYANYVARDV